MIEEAGEQQQLEDLERLGFSPEDALLLFDAGVDYTSACEWKEKNPGDSAREIAAFVSISPAEPLAWRSVPFSPEEAEQWIACGVGAAQAAKLDELSVAPAELIELGLTTERLGDLIEAVEQVRPLRARASLRESLGWRDLFEEHQRDEWLHTGLMPEECLSLYQTEVTPSQAKEWLEACPADTAGKMIQYLRIPQLDFSSALRWRINFPDDNPDDIARFCSLLAGDREAGMLGGYPLRFRGQETELGKQSLGLSELSEILEAVGERFSSSPGEMPIWVLDWHQEYPEDSTESILSFVADSGIEGPAALRWRLRYPDDSPEEISAFVSGTGLAAWEALDWRQVYPAMDHQQIRHFIEESGLSPEESLAMHRVLPSHSAAQLMEVSDQLGQDLLEAGVVSWIAQHPDDSPEFIKSYMEISRLEFDDALWWRGAGFTAEECLDWWQVYSYHIDDPVDCAAWKEAGFNASMVDDWCTMTANLSSGSDLSEALAWRRAGFSEFSDAEVTRICQWIHAGITDPEQAGAWDSAGLPVEEAVLYLSCGCTEPDIASGWHQLNYSATFAAALLEPLGEWVTPEQASDRLGGDLSLKFAADLNAWRQHGFEPDDAKEWLDYGVADPETATQWKPYFRPREAACWIMQGCLSAQVAADWRDAGFTPLRASGLVRDRRQSEWVSPGQIHPSLHGRDFDSAFESQQ